MCDDVTMVEGGGVMKRFVQRLAAVLNHDTGGADGLVWNSGLILANCVLDF